MKIIVLAGGLSMERNVSLSSGTRICRALRNRGHKAVLVDMFLGLEDYAGSLADIFVFHPEYQLPRIDPVVAYSVSCITAVDHRCPVVLPPVGKHPDGNGKFSREIDFRQIHHRPPAGGNAVEVDQPQIIAHGPNGIAYPGCR